jgi:hypothetical protein
MACKKLYACRFNLYWSLPFFKAVVSTDFLSEHFYRLHDNVNIGSFFLWNWYSVVRGTDDSDGILFKYECCYLCGYTSVFLGLNTCNPILYAIFACNFPNIVSLTAAGLYILNLGIIIVILMNVFWNNPNSVD